MVTTGDEAPDFELADQHGAPVRLAGFRGTSNVVLVFYPLAFSPVCSGELAALRDGFPLPGAAPAALLTVSVDSMFAHRAWADAEGFGFPLLSDFWPHGAVARAYGVFDEQAGVALRGTFIIGRDGRIAWQVVSPLPQPRDIAQYARALAAL